VLAPCLELVLHKIVMGTRLCADSEIVSGRVSGFVEAVRPAAEH
jgi:hypothetical protein